MTTWGVVGNRAVPEGRAQPPGARLWTSSFRSTCWMWVATVFGEMNRSRAISAWLRPRARRSSTSRSRGVRLSRWGGQSAPPCRWHCAAAGAAIGPERAARLARKASRCRVVGPNQQPGDAVECLDPCRGKRKTSGRSSPNLSRSSLQTSYPVMPESSTANRTRHGLTLFRERERFEPGGRLAGRKLGPFERCNNQRAADHVAISDQQRTAAVRSPRQAASDPDPRY